MTLKFEERVKAIREGIKKYYSGKNMEFEILGNRMIVFQGNPSRKIVVIKRDEADIWFNNDVQQILKFRLDKNCFKLKDEIEKIMNKRTVTITVTKKLIDTTEDKTETKNEEKKNGRRGRKSGRK